MLKKVSNLSISSRRELHHCDKGTKMYLYRNDIPMLEVKVKFAFKRKPTNVIYDSLKLIRWT
jgi:hypothetical protein